MLDQQWLSTFAPVGVIPRPNQWQPIGAGVFVFFHDVVWLVTARHVLPEAGMHFGVLVHLNDRPQVIDLTDVMANMASMGWIRSDEQDVAIAPMPTPREGTLGIKAVSQEQILAINDVLPSMPSLTGGCPYGLPGVDPNRYTPLVLDGIVAGTDPESKTLFISTPTFLGSSGGPIIVVRSPFNPAGGVTVGKQTVLLAGIVSKVQTIQPRNDAQAAPLRLGVGVAINAVLDLLNGSEAIAMVERIQSAKQDTE